MASSSKSIASLALFLALNLLFFSYVSACDTCSSPKPKPKPFPTPTTPSNTGKCPRDALQLNVCASLLGGLVGVSVPQKSKCCSLLDGLVDLDAAVCLCTAIKANVLGINLNVPLSLEVLLNVCDKKVPPKFTCT